MELVRIAINQDNISKYKKICWFVKDDFEQEVYALEDMLDIKVVYVINERNESKEILFATKSGEEGKGYAALGFKMLLDHISNRNDINTICIPSYNPISLELAARNGLNYDMNGYYSLSLNDYQSSKVRKRSN